MAWLGAGSGFGELPEVPEDLDPGLTYRQPGVKLTLLAEHPDLVTPTGIDVDEGGRIWLVASHTHFRPEGYPGPEHDEILAFASDGSDRRVFATRTKATMDLELGPDGWVYLAERDRILRLRDADGDGVADVEENVAVLDTEETYPHNGLAGIAFHPDGRLYFSLGENYWKDWTLRGTDGSSVSGTGEGGIFHCSPEGRNVARIAWGFWNPFGLCIREDGEMFAAENDPGSRPPCRLLHIVEGGDYGYQRRYGRAPFHPFVVWDGEIAGTLPMLAPTGEAPCGVQPLGGGLLVPSWSDNRIDYFPLRPKGAGYETERIELVKGSDEFRPTCIARGPDGAYYLTDWVYTSYDVHQRGRLWKLEVEEDAAGWVVREPAPEHPRRRLAKSLAAGSEGHRDTKQIVRWSLSTDPYLASAGLVELALRVGDLPWEEVAGWEPAERAAFVRACHRGEPRNEERARKALADEDPEVQFEALHWIADEDLLGLRGDVKALMRSPHLSYELFEACLAASNTLSGNPRAGISDEKMLLERVRDQAVAVRIRAFALRLLPPEKKRVSPTLLGRLLEEDDPDLGLEAVRTLAGKAGSEAAQALLAEVAADRARPDGLRAEAIVGLAAEPERHAVLLRKLSKSPVEPVAGEARRALRSAGLFDDPEPLLATEMAGLTDLDAWWQRLDEVEGKPDLAAGRRLFFHPRLARCATCHRHSGRGRVVGPDLSTAGDRGDRQWLLESIVEPSREVSPQFYPRSLTLEDGSTFVGFLLRKGGRSGKEFYRQITGDERAIRKLEIVGRQELRTSLMPVGLLLNLTAEEARDLLAFLEASRS